MIETRTNQVHAVASSDGTGPYVEGSGGGDRRSVLTPLLLIVSLLLVAGFLFLLNNRTVNIFDEGILLTGTMRTMAGNVLHRDFYYNYGPGQLYLLAGLFKIFGPSVLVERLSECLLAAFLVLSVYWLTRRYCSRAVSVGAACVCVLWVIGQMMYQSLMNPLCTFAVWASWLMLPVDNASRQRRNSLVAGLSAAMMFLFRYDMGAGLVAANIASALLMFSMRERSLRRGLSGLHKNVLWSYVVGFAIPVVPAALAYLSVAPLHDLLYDVVIYNAKYYRFGRGLPLPKLVFGEAFENIVVYVLPVLIALGLWMAIDYSLRRRKETNASVVRLPEWVNLLIAASITAAFLYVKGIVRLSAGQMYGSTMPCILVAAILFQHRAELNIWLRGVFAAAVVLFIATAVSATDVRLVNGRHLRPLVVNWLVSPNRQPPWPPYRSLCQSGTPITRGMCFLLDPDRMKTVEYVDAHTTPADTLYVGLSHHDRIYMNDNLTYFAAQRIPATRWTQFDPFLENRADIQREMISDLEHNRPPYVVLDSEFENAGEPNGSSISTGVHLLDNYIAAHYSAVERFGEMTILKRDS